MDFDLNTLHDITGGFKTVPENFMPATGARALLLEDPFLLWCQFHGRDHGFEKDAGEFSLSDFIMSAGRDFEAAWIRNVCGDDVTYCLTDDRDVRRAQGVLKTLELMHKKTPVIAHAALWNARARVYGSADLLVLTSWLYGKFPHLKPKKPEQDHYVVIDLKFTRNLHKPSKSKPLAAYGAQTRIYSYAVGHMQGFMPRRAFLISRDRHDDPIPVEVTSKIGKPLDKDLADLRDEYLAIKQKNWLPWKNAEVAPNFSNAQDAPWSGAKQRVAEEFMPGRPLEWLPRIGKREAESLQKLGYQSLDDMLSANPDDLPLEQINGIGESSARQIRAVLKANRSHRATPIPPGIVPKAKKVELYVDYEYLPDLRCSYDEPWPKCLEGHEMVFLIGCGWAESGRWYYKEFVAEQETLDAEKKLWQKFLGFLKSKEVLGPGADAVLWHFSPAEVWQSDRAAVRCGLPALSNLPWCDLQKSVLDLPFACPGAWSFGLKPLVKALSKVAPDYAVSWPTELGDGAAAAVVGWKMYESEEPLKTREYHLLGEYLEIDCKSMWQLLKWMRANCADAEGVVLKKASAQACLERRSYELPEPKRHRNGWYAMVWMD